MIAAPFFFPPLTIPDLFSYVMRMESSLRDAPYDVTKGMVALKVLQPGPSFKHWRSHWRPDSSTACCCCKHGERPTTSLPEGFEQRAKCALG